jgi:hypothetical protein
MTRTVEDLVRQEIVYCVSHLIYELCQTTGGGGIDNLHERACDLFAPVPDFEEAAFQHEWTFSKGEWSKPCACGRLVFIGTAEDLCNVEDIDTGDYDREIFEHWIVSDWLAEQLEAKGERIDHDFAGLTIWGRTTTGQGIANDYVIEQIHMDATKRVADMIGGAA